MAHSRKKTLGSEAVAGGLLPGFTLIEIVLVLAIAGLLLVVIFTAVVGAQRARRDTHRKHDLALFVGVMLDYESNKMGVPVKTIAEGNQFMASAFSSQHDPTSGQAYQLIVADFMIPHKMFPPLGTIMYIYGHRCAKDYEDPSNPTLVPGDNIVDLPQSGGGTSEGFAVTMTLESGGTICEDNGGH